MVSIIRVWLLFKLRSVRVEFESSSRLTLLNNIETKCKEKGESGKPSELYLWLIRCQEKSKNFYYDCIGVNADDWIIYWILLFLE